MIHQQASQPATVEILNRLFIFYINIIIIIVEIVAWTRGSSEISFGFDDGLTLRDVEECALIAPCTMR